MKRLLALTLLLLSLSTHTSKAQTLPKDVDRKMDSLFFNYNSETPGVSVVVMEGGKIIFKKGYGAANLEYGVPVTSKTVFHMASVSKQFTAFSIYLLEKQGKISMEDDIRKYFPELPNYGKTIKIKHLLAHTSGLRDQWALLTLAGWSMEDVITTEQILTLVAKQKQLNFETGTAFGYSNTGYTLLAELIARVTGQSFATFAKVNIFDPLQMNDTQIYDDFHKIVKNRAYSYEKVKGTGIYRKKELHYSTAGPTSLFTTAEDMAKWANNFDNPKVGDAKLIAAFNKVSLFDNGKPVVWSASRNDTTYHAKGQLVWKYNSLDIFSHGGHDAGFRIWLARFPQRNVSIITLSNDEHYDILRTGLKITDLYFPNQPKDPVAYRAPNPVQDEPEYSTDFKSLVGDYYSDELSIRYTVKMQDDKLVMTHNRLGTIELTQTGDYKFSGVNSFGFDLEFLKTGKEITEFSISNFGAKNVKFKRVKS
ncbi:MAG TPA: serine hydrolase domain-containing protein [Ohtaekwangia sp.]|uniref:serine hydrolase domain-containing protein n=1 Tax=Ohtaekwangia sp. TaxID=2066019 RepID=UPI002F925916